MQIPKTKSNFHVFIFVKEREDTESPFTPSITFVPVIPSERDSRSRSIFFPANGNEKMHFFINARKKKIYINLQPISKIHEIIT